MTVMINYEFKLKISIIEIERKTNSLDRNSNNIHPEKPAGGISALKRTFSITNERIITCFVSKSRVLSPLS